MSDPTAQTQTPDLPQQIASAPGNIWKRLRDALKVKTREQAVQLVGQDEGAAETARMILATATDDILTRKSQAGRAAPRAPEDTLYGGRGGLAI